MLALRADIPIIMSTGYSASIDEEAALKMGLRQLLLKPVPAKVLLEVVARHLNPKALLHQQPGTLL
jgi:CheY-like chemotaxis protein